MALIVPRAVVALAAARVQAAAVPCVIEITLSCADLWPGGPVIAPQQENCLLRETSARENA
jgi:hypothetical protein